MYATFGYDHMLIGVQWTVLWYRNGKDLVCSESLTWQGGIGGYGYSQCALTEDKWLPGEYEVQLFLGSTWWISGRFRISGEPLPPVGSNDRPVKILMMAGTDANLSTKAGQVMADMLLKETGLNFEVVVLPDYAAVIEELCAYPDSAFGILPAMAYVLANDLCSADAALTAIHNGYPVYWSEILVRRDSPYTSLADLDGKVWGYPGPTSTSGYLIPLAMLDEAGIKPGESVQVGSHPQAIQAVYDGEVDFASAYYSPPSKPEDQPVWQDGEEPDIPQNLISQCGLNADNNLYCGDWRVLDARVSISGSSPDVVQKVRILAISPAIPNDSIIFAPAFPADQRKEIEAALLALVQSTDWDNTFGSSDLYNWEGILLANDTDYNFARKAVEINGITLDFYKK